MYYCHTAAGQWTSHALWSTEFRKSSQPLRTWESWDDCNFELHFDMYIYIYCMQLTNSVLLKDIQRLSICIYLHLLQHCCMPLASPWYTFDMFNKSINSSNNHRSAKGPLENAAIIDRVSYPKGYDTCMLVGKSVVCVYSLCHREICQMEKGAGHFTLTAVNVSGLYHQHSALIKHFTAAVGNHIQIHESSPTQVHQGSCSYGYHTDPSAVMKHWGINGNVATSPVWPPASVPWAQIISIPTCKHSDMHGAWTKNLPMTTSPMANAI